MEKTKSTNPVPSLSTQSLEIKRVFDAPPENVFKAFRSPEIFKQWWGPAGFTCPVAQIDFRVGGKYLFCMKAPDGKQYWSTGAYKEILDNRRLVLSDHFSDERGNHLSAKEIGMEGDWPDSLVIAFSFEEEKIGKTAFTLVHEGIPEEAKDDCIKGWNGSLDKLEAVVKSASSSVAA